MQQFLKLVNSSLNDIYSEGEIRLFGNLILENISGYSRTQLLVHKNDELREDQRTLAIHYLERLINHEPIQYILSEAEFYGLKFKVNPAVLIPRPETEELVDWIEPPHPPKGGFLSGTPTMLDIGAGSGCIAVSLKKKFPSADVSAMDISSEAMMVARENAALNQVKIMFFQDDILNPQKEYGTYDIIVSNPPYIPASEHMEMDRNVTDFEPHLALFVPDYDPLLFYRNIAGFASAHLTPSGNLYFETHQNLAQECKQLLEDYGFANVEIRKDISGNERMVKGTWKPAIQ